MRSVCCLVFFVFYIGTTIAQSPVKEFDSLTYDDRFYAEFAVNKKIPKGIRPQVLTALSFYPELKNLKIIFRIRKRKTPLTSRPRITSVFRKKKNRAYLITISDKTTSELSPILFHKLPYNAQIGVVGHELGHIIEYNDKNTFQLLGLSFNILNPKFADKFEWNTDRTAILKGLGYQLLDWSTYVRSALNIAEWKGVSKTLFEGNDLKVNQRYMNPETILEHIDDTNLYRPMR